MSLKSWKAGSNLTCCYDHEWGLKNLCITVCIIQVMRKNHFKYASFKGAPIDDSHWYLLCVGDKAPGSFNNGIIYQIEWPFWWYTCTLFMLLQVNYKWVKLNSSRLAHCAMSWLMLQQTGSLYVNFSATFYILTAALNQMVQSWEDDIPDVEKMCPFCGGTQCWWGTYLAEVI